MPTKATVGLKKYEKRILFLIRKGSSESLLVLLVYLGAHSEQSYNLFWVAWAITAYFFCSVNGFFEFRDYLLFAEGLPQ